MMKELPHPLWQGLHVLPPHLPTFIGTLLLLALIGLLVSLWLRRHRPAELVLPPLPRETAPVPRGSLKSRLEAIVRKALSDKNYRRGFHELAAAVRAALSKRTGLEFDRMTVAEMREVLRGRNLVKALDFVEEGQFGSREPTPADLEQALSALTASLSRGGRISLRKARR